MTSDFQVLVMRVQTLGPTPDFSPSRLLQSFEDPLVQRLVTSNLHNHLVRVGSLTETRNMVRIALLHIGHHLGLLPVHPLYPALLLTIVCVSILIDERLEDQGQVKSVSTECARF